MTFRRYLQAALPAVDVYSYFSTDGVWKISFFTEDGLELGNYTFTKKELLEKTGLFSENETEFMVPRFSVLAADRNGLMVFVSFSEQGVRGKIIFLPIVVEEEIRTLAEEE